MTESAFLRMVLDLAKLYGWKRAHFRAARTKKGWRTAVAGDGKGFPDLVLLRGFEMIVAELKVGRKQLTPEQVAWLKAFDLAGVRTFVWRPADWKTIERILAR